MSVFSRRRTATDSAGAAGARTEPSHQVIGAAHGFRIGTALDAVLRDARHGWRGLWKAPAFAAIAIATLALGIGATTAIFSVVNAMLIAPLPYRDPSRLAIVWSDMTAAGYPRAPLSGPELFDLRQRATMFTGFSAIWSTSGVFIDNGQSEQIRVGVVSADFFSTLGADAAIGRTFRAEDEPQTAPTSIVLGSSFWHRRFGGDPTMVGRAIRVNASSMTVVGVMPDDFRLLLPRDANVPDDLDGFVPFSRLLARSPRGQQFIRVIGRLKPGVTVE